MMKKSNDGFVRADKIDLRSIDEQLQKHLNKVLIMQKNKQIEKENDNHVHLYKSGSAINSLHTDTKFISAFKKKKKQEWEIEPSKLIIKSVIARGTFGTVHRGIYHNQDVAVKLLNLREEGQRTIAEVASLRTAFTQEVAV
ncbi:hypothetical protein Lal_00024041 [Lupinus albus]|uniref:Putative dual-specificity kinase n=1 Tax=Lupinus albus TaxID=3870 RepID=A0A6A4PJ15_LUPAL|nr:putative dual-specificity kinase [Lupinus albus]KAF1888029.1 hypothetical protein Lal_00024041 [Lupinus albus]